MTDIKINRALTLMSEIGEAIGKIKIMEDIASNTKLGLNFDAYESLNQLQEMKQEVREVLFEECESIVDLQCDIRKRIEELKID